MKRVLWAACAVQSFVLQPPQLQRPAAFQRTAAIRAVDDDRPAESDAEAARIAEMRARMEAMFGGGEAPAAEPATEPAAEAPAAELPAVEAPAAEAPAAKTPDAPEPAPPAVAAEPVPPAVTADDDDAAMRARMEGLFPSGGDAASTDGTEPAPPAESGRREPSGDPPDDLASELSKLREVRGTPEAAEPAPPSSDLPAGLADALNPQGAAGEARPAVPAGVALDLAEAARHACDATVAAVLEGKRRVLIEARVEGLDPAQPTLDGSAVLAWATGALARLPYDHLVLLDAAGTTRLTEEAGITADPLLLTFGQAVEEETPESTLYVVFAPRTNDDMVATCVEIEDLRGPPRLRADAVTGAPEI